ncbi:hypothetical protein D3C87_1887570 [compost metagenome]
MRANVAVKGAKSYSKRVDGSDEKSVAGANDLVGIAKDVASLDGALTLDAVLEGAAAKLEGAPADVKAAGKRALAAVGKLADSVYEHAVYLTVKSAQLVSAAAGKA